MHFFGKVFEIRCVFHTHSISQSSVATFPVLRSHMCLVVTMLGNMVPDNLSRTSVLSGSFLFYVLPGLLPDLTFSSWRCLCHVFLTGSGLFHFVLRLF